MKQESQEFKERVICALKKLIWIN